MSDAATAHRLLIKGALAEPRIELLRAGLDPAWEILAWRPRDGDAALARALCRVDAFMSMSWRAGMPAAPRLRLLQLPGAGLDGIDFAALPAHTTVCNVYEHEIGIAEYLVLAMLEWEIRLARMDEELRRGLWLRSFVTDAPLHGELCGKQVGFVGYGRIARATARRLRAFGVRVRACTRTPSHANEDVDEIAGMDMLDAMLAACDYVVVTCPLSDETRGLIDAHRIACMRSDAVLANVARGEVVVERDLYEALAERRIGGAIIDTWYRYPRSEPGAVSGELPACLPSAYPFHELDNVIMSPHASGWSAGLMRRRMAVVADNLNRLVRGLPLHNVARDGAA